MLTLLCDPLAGRGPSQRCLFFETEYFLPLSICRFDHILVRILFSLELNDI